MSADTYVQLRKSLLDGTQYAELSLEAVVCYCVLADRHRLSEVTGYCDSYGRLCVVYPQESLGKILRCKRKKVAKVLQELEECKLISRRHQGMNKADVIYVQAIPMCQDDTSVCVSDGHQDVSRENENNNKFIKNELNKSSADRDDITMALLEKWNYRYISSISAAHEKWAGVIIDIAVDIMCSTGQEIFVAGDMRDTAYVQAVIMRLTMSRITDLINKLIACDHIFSDVPYIRTMLYNFGLSAPAYSY